MSFALYIATLLAILIATAYLYLKRAFSYWKRRNVPYVEPIFPFGNLKNVFLQKLSFSDELKRLYNITNGPFYGIYSSISPALLVRDPQIIRNILVKDFSNFDERGWHIDEDVDPMYNNILMQNGPKWKQMRSTLTPAFTSGKIKGMFSTMIECGKSLEKFMKKYANNGETVDVREVFALYGTNLVASTAFGIDIDCFENPNSEFRKYGSRFFEKSVKNAMRKGLTFSAPKLAKLFRVRFIDKDVANFMTDVVKQNIEYREKNHISRKDLFQLLLQVRNSGDIHEGDDDWTTNASENKKSLSIDEITAQAHIFLVGGYESTSLTQSFCLYEMAKDPSKQEKAYKEIVSVLEKHNGELSYECFTEMKYMDNCIEGNIKT